MQLKILINQTMSEKKKIESIDTSQPTITHSKVSSRTRSGSTEQSTKVMDLPTCEDDQQESDHNWGFENSMAVEQTKPESTKVNLATPTSSGTSYSSSIVTEGEVNMLVTDTFFYELDDLIDVDQKINGCYSRDDGTKQLERLYMEYLQLLNYGDE